MLRPDVCHQRLMGRLGQIVKAVIRRHKVMDLHNFYP